MKQGDKALIVLLILIAIIGLSVLWHFRSNSPKRTAVIIVNGIEVRRIDLSSVRKPFTFQVEPRPGEYNIIAVEPGRIRVIEASCPNQIDVKQGWISEPLQSIICVPNQLVIRIEGPDSSNGIDGTAY